MDSTALEGCEGVGESTLEIPMCTDIVKQKDTQVCYVRRKRPLTELMPEHSYVVSRFRSNCQHSAQQTEAEKVTSANGVPNNHNAMNNRSNNQTSHKWSGQPKGIEK